MRGVTDVGTFRADSQLPLTGIRVIDFTWIVAGPQATRILADLGADVIRVENESYLDSMRLSAPVDGPPSYERSGMFNNLNRNKRSITVNIHHPEGRSVIEQLLQTSDVVVENFSATVFERWGFGWDRLQELNPRLIYLSLSGFGHHGRNSHYVTWGPTAQAISGLTRVVGLPGLPPTGWGYAYLDHSAGYYGAIALLLALRQREKSGLGQYIDLSQVEIGMAVNAIPMLDYQVNGRAYEHIGNHSRSPGVAPHNIYRARGADRWIAIAAETDQQWLDLCGVLEVPDLRRDERFASNTARLQNEGELDSLIEAVTARYHPRELMYLLQAKGVPAGVVQTQEDKMEHDPQVTAREFFVRADHPELGERNFEGLPFKYSRSRWRVDRGAPVLGEHTREVLEGVLGYSTPRIDALSAEMAV